MAGAKLPGDVVEQMWDAYLDRQTVNHVAVTVGVSRHAAKRYIEEGDPSRSIEPFVIRYAKMIRHQVRVKDKRVVYTQANALAALQSQIKGLDELIALAIHRVRKTINQRKPSLTDVAKCIEIRNNVLLRMKPFGEIERTTTTETHESFAGRSTVELEHFAEHGTWPEEPSEPPPLAAPTRQPHAASLPAPPVDQLYPDEHDPTPDHQPAELPAHQQEHQHHDQPAVRPDGHPDGPLTDLRDDPAIGSETSQYTSQREEGEGGTAPELGVGAFSEPVDVAADSLATFRRRGRA